MNAASITYTAIKPDLRNIKACQQKIVTNTQCHEPGARMLI
jgi:hypothetical protein